MSGQLPDIPQGRSELRRPHAQHDRLALETGPPRVADTTDAGENADVARARKRDHVEPDTERRIPERSAEKNLARASGRTIKRNPARETRRPGRVSVAGENLARRRVDCSGIRIGNGDRTRPAAALDRRCQAPGQQQTSTCQKSPVGFLSHGAGLC